MPADAGPLLVFGPRSLDYDFGPSHPLTPLRFGPGIDLLREVGAEPSIAPEPAADEELLWVHSRRYVETVRRHGDAPWLPEELGIGHADNPPFDGMHDAAAAVAGGSIRAMEAILRGDTLHAHHPGGGLHHAMPERAWGFCIYNDPALAIARARHEGLRVLYLDVDVHHGDGVQAMFADDPGVLTISVHESGRYLFPGTGFPTELGSGSATGTSVNLPFEPLSGGDGWLGVILSIVPQLAAAFGPDVVVSQHGADAHAWDPLAHLRVTTTAQGLVAQMVDVLAHRYAAGRWLATGGGGYAAYRVVPRVWALTWLAGAHREPPTLIPASWRSRWESAAAAFGDAPLPTSFLDPQNLGLPYSEAQGVAERASAETAIHVQAVVVPRLLRAAAERGWWQAPFRWPPAGVSIAGVRAVAAAGSPVVEPSVDLAQLDRLELAPRVIAPFEVTEAVAVLRAAVSEAGVHLTAAVDGTTIVGVVMSAPSTDAAGERSLLVVGVAPSYRRQGLATRLLAAHLEAADPGAAPTEALITVAEHDAIEPLDVAARSAIARALLDRAGFRPTRVPPRVAEIDRWAVAGRRPSVPG